MHVQVVTFSLDGITEEQYRDACAEETATFAALPGLLGKVWLGSRETNTYGGLYLWRDRDWHDAYVNGEVFRSLNEDPALADVQSRSFDVLEELTKATQPHIVLV